MSCRRLLKGDAIECPDDGADVQSVITLPKDTRVGVYRIERLLGEGGMGFVYEATHELLNRRSAIKMLRPELAKHDQVVARFLNEAKAVNLIDHQNIVNVYDYGDSLDGSVYFVMEFLEGETLDEVMGRRRPMQIPLVLHLFGQIGKALAAAHAKQVVHRDLKPSNVYVVARENNPYYVKLLDFGIAQLRGAGAVQGLTLDGSVIGTPQYMSPEQISGRPVDARCDVWALGVMLYRATTGQMPFKGDAFPQLADQIVHHTPVPAGKLAALPAAMSALIASCLERELGDRCGSVSELLDGFERVKRECKLDDDAILAAVTAESTAVDIGALMGRRARTRDSFAPSVPEFQGVDQRGAPTEPAPPPLPPPRSRLGRYIAIGAIAGALGGAVYFEYSRSTAVEPDGELTAERPARRSIVEAVAAGDIAGARALAEQDLRGVIGSATLQHQGFAVDALAVAHGPATAPLLYAALRSPEIRLKAARALGELALPDAAPKVRAALAESGDKLKVELAAVLVRLGDKDARAIAVRALADPAQQLTAAVALADAGDAAGRAVLADAVRTLPAGRESWRRAAGALVKLGDTGARALLQGELTQPDAARAIGAAELLARAGDASARAQLARVAADPEFAERGAAALALARLGDRRALDRVGDGLASGAADDRRRALAICGLLGADAAHHTAAIARLATDDPDPVVRMTAAAVVLSL
jgi:serine/threonine protein kinase/HEAT repeat protein